MASNNLHQPAQPQVPTFGTTIKARREELGLSLREAAKLIGTMSYGRLRDLERELDPHSGLPTRPTEAQALRIAQAYKLDKRATLRLAGYTSIGPLEEWEEDLVLAARKLAPDHRKRVLDLLAGLPPESKV